MREFPLESLRPDTDPKHRIRLAVGGWVLLYNLYYKRGANSFAFRVRPAPFVTLQE
jgi:hypothetical protein